MNATRAVTKANKDPNCRHYFVDDTVDGVETRTVVHEDELDAPATKPRFSPEAATEIKSSISVLKKIEVSK